MNAVISAYMMGGTMDMVGGGGNWGNPNALQDHYDRHGSDFGSVSPQDYANQANDFYNNRANYQTKTDQFGITRVYDATTNTFGAYNADGTTKTFFKPFSGSSYFKP